MRIRMDSEVLGMLNSIDEILARGDSSSLQLWGVLSALRGPDYPGTEQTKAVTTAIIRSLAFPLTARAAAQGIHISATFATAEEVKAADLRDLRFSARIAGEHFATHIGIAAYWLGL